MSRKSIGRQLLPGSQLSARYLPAEAAITLVLCASLWFFPAQLRAQITRLQFDSFPACIAMCFHQDRFGFIWIGTEDGLVRYDGVSFKQYSHIPFDSTSVSYNWVMDIEEDAEGNLWVGGGYAARTSCRPACPPRGCEVSA
jgi:hypothetical protein